MRGHVEYECFEFPSSGHHFGPGFDTCGRGWSKRPFGTLGCHHFPGHHGPRPGDWDAARHELDRSPERRGPGPLGSLHHQGPEHDDGYHGPGHHGRPGCGRHGPLERPCRGLQEHDYHGPTERHGARGSGRHGAPELDHYGHDGPPSCGRRPYHLHGHGRCLSPGQHEHRHKHCGPRPGPYRPHPWSRHNPASHWFGHHRQPAFDHHERPGHHKPGFDHHSHGRPWFGPRRPNHYDCSNGGRSRIPNCEGCCQTEPHSSGNKENRASRHGGRKESGPWTERNKEQDPTGDTVLVQRIVVEKAPRPQSV